MTTAGQPALPPSLAALVSSFERAVVAAVEESAAIVQAGRDGSGLGPAAAPPRRVLDGLEATLHRIASSTTDLVAGDGTFRGSQAALELVVAHQPRSALIVLARLDPAFAGQGALSAIAHDALLGFDFEVLGLALGAMTDEQLDSERNEGGALHTLQSAEFRTSLARHPEAVTAKAGYGAVTAALIGPVLAARRSREDHPAGLPADVAAVETGLRWIRSVHKVFPLLVADIADQIEPAVQRLPDERARLRSDARFIIDDVRRRVRPVTGPVAGRVPEAVIAG